MVMERPRDDRLFFLAKMTLNEDSYTTSQPDQGVRSKQAGCGLNGFGAISS